MKKIILLLLVSTLYYGQLSPKVDKLYQKLSKSERYESKNISVDGHESEIYKIHTEIGKIATDKELKYIALNGNIITKNYIANILLSKKSKLLKKIFREYLKTNDSIQMQSGCVGYYSFLPNEIYNKVAYEKGNINDAEWYKKWKDSLIHSKTELDSNDLNMIEVFKSETQWKMKEVNSLIYKFDQIALNYKKSPQNIIDLICAYHLYENVKVPYFEKIAYFEKRYNSDYIKKYLNFCRYGIREKPINF
jgi:hypothetical protein